MTQRQWQIVIDKLHKYKEVNVSDDIVLILWDNGDVSAIDRQDGHCIMCASTADRIKFLFVD